MQPVCTLGYVPWDKTQRFESLPDSRVLSLIQMDDMTLYNASVDRADRIDPGSSCAVGEQQVDGGFDSASRRSYRILVVDDFAPLVKMLSVLLSKLGHQVEVASNGQQALELVRLGRPQVVFADLEMPLMSGFDFARRVSAETDSPCWLVAISGYTRDQVRDDAFAAGFRQFLVKPFGIPELQAVLAAASPHLTTV